MDKIKSSILASKLPTRPVPECGFEGSEDSDDLSDKSWDDLKPVASEVEKEALGLSNTVQNLYQGTPKCQCCINWVDELPKEAQEQSDFSAYSEHALVVRHMVGHGTKRARVVHSIDIQSPLLRKVLGSVFDGYPGLTTNLSELTFNAPFRAFFHRREELAKATAEESDPKTKDHLKLLSKVINSELAGTIRSYGEQLSNKVIDYDLVWTLFKPNELIYANVNGSERILKTINEADMGSMLGTTFWRVPCELVNWNGRAFAWDSSTVTIQSFKGTKPIQDLECFPLAFHPNVEGLKARLTARGKKWADLSGMHHRYYKARSGENIVSPDEKCPPPSGKTSGRVVIDSEAYYEYSGHGRPHMRALKDKLVSLPPPPGPRTYHKHHHNPGPPPPMMPFDLPPPPMGCSFPVEHTGPPPPRKSKRIPGDPTPYSPAPLNMANATTKPSELTSEHLLLCNDTVKAYSLVTKKWVVLNVDGIEDIVWNEDAFSHLVLPGTYKNVLLSLVNSQLEADDAFDDFIAGKGQGLNFLLTGSPGVGKTLTAESIAEHIRTPLYYLSAGELGDTANDIEAAFSRISTLVTKWHAVLLLDEADVFLEERRTDSLERNKLVSLFLKVLEYYQGILFLTTNRVKAFDQAFESRIHVTINYPDLDSTARGSIWKYLIKRCPQAEAISDVDLARLAELNINGRQIKNVVKVASLLSKRSKSPLSISHIDMSLQTIRGSIFVSSKQASRYEY